MFIRTLGSAVGIAVFGSIANSTLADRFRHPPASVAGQLPRAVDAASISFTKRHQSAAAIEYTRVALFDAVHYVFWALLAVARARARRAPADAGARGGAPVRLAAHTPPPGWGRRP